MSRSPFSEICEEFVDESLRLDPVLATMCGVHDYDAVWGDPSLGAVRRRCEWLRGVAKRLEDEVDRDQLDAFEQIDLRLLQSTIDAQLIGFERQHEPERNPFQYPDQCMYGLYLLYTREFAPLAERVESICKRLERTSAYLERAKETVTSCPGIFAEIALEVTDEAPGFLDEIAERLATEVPERKEAVAHAVERARTAFAEYENWVREELLPRASGEFAVGEAVFNARLRDEHLLADDRESLEAYGVRLLAETQREMAQVAARIDAGKDWKQVVEAAKRDHPPADGVLDAYRHEVERTRRFLIDRRLAPIPEGEELEVIDTPSFERSRIPYAAYLMPGPFDKVQRGSFYVTGVDSEASKEEIEATLLGHNLHTIPVVALHEAYPGHHLQLCWANRSRNRLRKISDSSVLAEGWALYCEEMMYEEGYFENDLVRLFQLKDTTLRAARVVIDCRLQTGRMSLDEATDFLVEEGALERPNARIEARRYAVTPTQPMSYSVGKRAILDLREESRARYGERFDLHDFHAAVLQAGTIPVGLVRQEVLHRLEHPDS